jgi:hypothetical protein
MRGGIQGVFKRAQCLLGRHQRCRKRVKEAMGRRVSVCEHCNAPMRQLADRSWIRDEGHADLLRASSSPSELV